MTGYPLFIKYETIFKNFIKSHDCNNMNLYPRVYQFIYKLSFGGCGSDEGDLDHEYQKIMSFGPNDFALLGFDLITYPFILIGIHKSIVYGKMVYTDKLISIAKRIIDYSGVENDEIVDFYQKIYNSLHEIVKNVKDREVYAKTVVSLSDQVSCEGGVVSKYKCKILAILGDLQKYDEIRFEKVDRGLSLRHAIDEDLKYISNIFDYHERLKTYKNEPNPLTDLGDRVVPVLLFIN
jgi:hypothetical protein